MPAALYGAIGTYLAFVVVAALAALGLSFFLFHKFVGAPEGNQLRRSANQAGFLARFLQFKQLIVGDIIRWGYIFLTLLIAFEGLVFSIMLMSANVVAGLLNIVFILLAELILRVIYELRMLTILIAKDTSSIHGILARRYGDAPAADAGYATPAGVASQSVQAQPARPARSAQPAQPARQYAPAASPAPAPAPQAADAGWTCPSCGHGGNQSMFCKYCGTPRP
jgi:hypothetical protein